MPPRRRRPAADEAAAVSTRATRRQRRAANATNNNNNNNNNSEAVAMIDEAPQQPPVHVQAAAAANVQVVPPTPPAAAPAAAISVSWWTVDLYATPPLTEGATPLVKRAMNAHNWSEEHARRVLKGYRQFMTLKARLEDWNATILSPSSVVDQIWHLHILDTQRYAADCITLCGQVVHHNVDAGLNGLTPEESDARRDRRANTRAALLEHFEENEIDKERVWKECFQEAERNEQDGVIVDVPAAEQADGPAAEQVDGPNLQDASVYITFSVQIDTTDDTMMLRAKPTTRVEKIKRYIANRLGVDPDTLRLLLDGDRLEFYETLADVGLQDGDRFDVLFEQCGC